MIEMFEKLAQLRARRLDAVLATVVSTSSAAPRTQGAQLLLSPHGTECGTIGGGALEKEAAALGAQLLFCQESRLFRHSPPRLDGSVCGGEVKRMAAIHFLERCALGLHCQPGERPPEGWAGRRPCPVAGRRHTCAAG